MLRCRAALAGLLAGALTLSGALAAAPAAGAPIGPAQGAAAPGTAATDVPATGVPATGVPATDVPATDVPATDVIVQWRPGVAAPERAAVRRAAGLARGAALSLPRTELVGVPAGESAQELADTLVDDPRVEHAEPDAWLTTSSDDPLFPRQWGLENRGQPIGGRAGVAGVDVRAPQAWAAAQQAPGAEVVVAITDGAFDATHPDLVDRLWRNPGETLNGLDDDGNGFVDDVHGWDFVTRRPVLPTTTAVERHATHVAGVAGAARDNGRGIAGTSDRVRLLPVVFLGPDGGPTSRAVDAVRYASANGAGVINASWGGSSPSRVLQQALASSPAVVVTAAGNVGGDNDLRPEYPAGYRLPNVVSVTAVTHRGDLADFANRGRRTVHLGAPGQDVVSTVPGDGYGSSSGTSMAVPFVSGAAALVRSVRPDLSAGRVVALLEQTVRPLPALRDTTVTGGMLDVEAAVRAAVDGASPAQPPTACPAGLPSAGFADLIGNAHAFAVDCAAWYSLVRGTSWSSYSPAAALTRGQAATLLAGLVDDAGRLPASARDAFDDDAGSVHEASIDRLAALGVLSGVGPRRFAPERPVTRGQMATLLVGTQELLTGVMMAGGATRFTDVQHDVHRSSIEKAYAAGLVRGTSTTTFSPGGPTRRDQAASLLTRELQVLVEATAVRPRRL